MSREIALSHPRLGSRTGAGVNVAVVDSGIHGSHPHVQGIQGGIGIHPDGRIDADHQDRLGHGTAVAAAIKEKAPDVELYAVKVFHAELKTAVSALSAAIDWSADQGIRLVNLSLGTPNEARKPELADAVSRANAAGTLVVSASESDGLIWWPGGMDSTIGVLLDWSCDRHALRLTRTSRGDAAFAASGYPRPIPGVSPARNLAGISFAVANATGVLARILEGEPDVSSPAEVWEVAADYAWPGSSAEGP